MTIPGKVTIGITSAAVGVLLGAVCFRRTEHKNVDPPKPVERAIRPRRPSLSYKQGSRPHRRSNTNRMRYVPPSLAAVRPSQSATRWGERGTRPRRIVTNEVKRLTGTRSPGTTAVPGARIATIRRPTIADLTQTRLDRTLRRGTTNMTAVAQPTLGFVRSAVPLTRRLSGGVFASFSSLYPKQSRYGRYGGRFSYQSDTRANTNLIGGRIRATSPLFVLGKMDYVPVRGVSGGTRFELSPESEAQNTLLSEFALIPRGTYVWMIWHASALVPKTTYVFAVTGLRSYSLGTLNPVEYGMQVRGLVAEYVGPISALVHGDTEVRGLMTDDRVYEFKTVDDLLTELSRTPATVPAGSRRAWLNGYDPIRKLADVCVGGRTSEEKHWEAPYVVTREIFAQALVNTETGKILDIAIVVRRILRTRAQP